MPCANLLTVGWALALTACVCAAQAPADFSARYENLARGKPYVLAPVPNYEYTRNDPHALTRLTDGAYTDVTKGQFWVQPTTVGWANPTAEITLDLGAHHAIRGLSFGTVVADGTDVQLPERMDVLVSVDGRRYYLTAAGSQSPRLPGAQALLAGATARVIRAPGAKETGWRDAKDRGIADTVRIEIGEMLERLR